MADRYNHLHCKRFGVGSPLATGGCSLDVGGEAGKDYSHACCSLIVVLSLISTLFLIHVLLSNLFFKNWVLYISDLHGVVFAGAFAAILARIYGCSGRPLLLFLNPKQVDVRKCLSFVQVIA